ncbi:hypothetical protein [Sphingorhabdus contaminans]|uniref:Uncharacterized protein n=1 Tax=Sphingorhabdus contaminans TaxID=1343899 RepID=A0A553WA87_9SPHN|nr:hypothetical protein [Sphingorhabdus contaminans]TSB01607.1 hypothetical protein FOM92_10505 [Sphingorhabdus contaminans]
MRLATFSWVVPMLALVNVANAKPKSSASSPSVCASYVGQNATFADFASVYASLPEFEPMTEFETAAQFEARKSRSAQTGAAIMLKISRADNYDGLMYDAEKQTLRVTDATFGRNNHDYQSLRNKVESKPQSLASDIAFDVATVKTLRETYTAANGFGAAVLVERTIFDTDVVYEAQTKWDSGAFLGQKGFTISQIPLDSASAKNFVEGSSAALLIIPKFKTTGKSVSGPTFRVPIERHYNQKVIVGDIQCGFLLRSNNTVAFAFAAK